MRERSMRGCGEGAEEALERWWGSVELVLLFGMQTTGKPWEVEKEMSSSLHEFTLSQLKPDFVPNLFWDVSASFIGFLFMSFTGFFAFFSLSSSSFFSVLLSSLSVLVFLFSSLCPLLSSLVWIQMMCSLFLCRWSRRVVSLSGKAGECEGEAIDPPEPFWFDCSLLSCSLFSVDWCVTCLSWTRDCWELQSEYAYTHSWSPFVEPLSPSGLFVSLSPALVSRANASHSFSSTAPAPDHPSSHPASTSSEIDTAPSVSHPPASSDINEKPKDKSPQEKSAAQSPELVVLCLNFSALSPAVQFLLCVVFIFATYSIYGVFLVRTVLLSLLFWCLPLVLLRC